MSNRNVRNRTSAKGAYEAPADPERELTPAFHTDLGFMYQGDLVQVLRQRPLTEYAGQIQLILTSPPFPLNKKKKYGNLTGDAYLEWLTGLAALTSRHT